MPKSRKIGARIDIFKCPKRDFLSIQNENLSAQIDIFKCPKREKLVPESIFLSAQIGNFWCPKREFKSPIVFFPWENTVQFFAESFIFLFYFFSRKKTRNFFLKK